MDWIWIVLIALVAVLALILLIAAVCFYMAFYAVRKPAPDEETFDIPPGKIYEPYRETMVAWMKEVRSLPHREYSITSFDGLTLHGKYYECEPGAPIELMMHGYRGTSERDLCGGVQRCFALKRNALIIDQRACGRSDGHIISFGINESRDCLAWIDFLIREFGEDVRIILTGISMGGSTVLITAGEALPPNVIGALADCGFSTAKDIIKKVIRQLHLPANLLYPFVKLGARIYGGFRLESKSATEAMRRCRIPVIFFHGDADDFVPCEMSRVNYEACTAEKRLVLISGAGHGLAYLVDSEGYLQALREFNNVYGI